MEERKRKKKRGIFTKLMVSFFAFTILTILIFVGSLLVVSIGIGGSPGINMYDIFDANGKVGKIEGISRIGGWVEKLDSDYHVVETWGRKETPNKSYTKQKFSELLAASQGTTSDYMGYMSYKSEAGEDYYYVTIVPRSVVNTDITVSLNGIPTWDAVFGILFLGLFLLLCVLMSYYLSSTIRKPLTRLSEGMERVRLGEEGVRILFPAKAEFADIKDTFNLMMERLETEKAEKLQNEQKKNRLLLDLSHDIKTPITTIKSYANALEANLVPENQKASVYQLIDTKANRVSHLMEDMFMMLKLDSTEYSMHTQKIDLSEFLRQICAEYYEEIEGNGYQFIIDIPEERIEASIDQRLFARVITNLLSNAVKYNKTGHEISISLKKENTDHKSLSIAVIDDGSSIDPDISSHLFDAFTRGDVARKTDGGTGLGLSIAKTIIQKHGGTISYHRQEDKNCFIIHVDR